MLSRLVIPRCGSSPSYFSGFLRSLAAARRGRGHFRTGKYCLKKLCWKQASPDAKKKPTQPSPPRPSLFFRNHALLSKLIQKVGGDGRKTSETAGGGIRHLLLQDVEDSLLALDELLGLGSAAPGTKTCGKSVCGCCHHERMLQDTKPANTCHLLSPF